VSWTRPAAAPSCPGTFHRPSPAGPSRTGSPPLRPYSLSSYTLLFQRCLLLCHGLRLSLHCDLVAIYFAASVRFLCWMTAMIILSFRSNDTTGFACKHRRDSTVPLVFFRSAFFMDCVASMIKNSLFSLFSLCFKYRL
jgi:hypothetical protein